MRQLYPFEMSFFTRITCLTSGRGGRGWGGGRGGGGGVLLLKIARGRGCCSCCCGRSCCRDCCCGSGFRSCFCCCSCSCSAARVAMVAPGPAEEATRPAAAKPRVPSHFSRTRDWVARMSRAAHVQPAQFTPHHFLHRRPSRFRRLVLVLSHPPDPRLFLISNLFISLGVLPFFAPAPLFLPLALPSSRLFDAPVRRQTSQPIAVVARAPPGPSEEAHCVRCEKKKMLSSMLQSRNNVSEGFLVKSTSLSFFDQDAL